MPFRVRLLIVLFGTNSVIQFILPHSAKAFNSLRHMVGQFAKRILLVTVPNVVQLLKNANLKLMASPHGVGVCTKIFWLIALTFLCGITTVQGQTLSSFDFLRLEPSAQAAALGGTSLTTTSNQGNVLFYNPALLGKDLDGNLSVSWLNHLSDLQAGALTYAQHLGPLGTGAVGVRFFHWGSITRADIHGERNGTFSSSNLALSAGLSRSWQSRLRYGASIHLLYASVGQFNAIAAAVDIGAAYHISEQGFVASAAVTNTGVVLSSLGPTRDELPMDIRIAVSKRLKYIPVLVGLTLHNLQNVHRITAVDDGFRHAIFSLQFQAIPAFHLRLGYSHRKRNLKSDRRLDLAGTAVGFGLRVRGFQVDYAFSSWSFAGLHQFTVARKFNRRRQ